MFRVRVPAQETYRSSIRPAIFDSVKQVMENLGMNKNVKTFFNGESEITRMIGTNFSEKFRTDQQTDVGFKDRQFVQFEIEQGEGLNELDSKFNWVSNPPFWFDSLTKAAIVPMFVSRKINVTINRYFKDRVMANQFRDKVQNTLVNGFVNVFSPTVHYPISYQMMSCFETIYDRLGNASVIDKSKISSFEWFKTNCIAPWDIITDIAGGNPCFVFKRHLDTLSLLFSGVNITTTSKGRYQGQYLVSFDYSFYFPDHTFFELHYPIMVYQQMTESKYIPTINKIMLDDYPKSQFYEASIPAKNRTYNSGYQIDRNPFMFVFPKEDNFRPKHVKDTHLMLQRLAVMDDVENQVVMNLFNFSELDSFWDEEVKSFIQKYHDKITIRHKSPFHLKVYSDDIEVNNKNLTLKENGDIVLKHSPTMSAIYRVCFFIDYGIWDYDEDAWEDIKWNCQYGKWVFTKIFPWMKVPVSRPCPTDPTIPWIDPNEIFPFIPHHPDKNGGLSLDATKLYMLDALLIAKNERFRDKTNPIDYLYLREGV